MTVQPGRSSTGRLWPSPHRTQVRVCVSSQSCSAAYTTFIAIGRAENPRHCLGYPPAVVIDEQHLKTYLKYLLSFLFPVGQPWLLLRREILLIMKKIQRFIDFLTWCLQMREHGRVDSHFQLKTKKLLFAYPRHFPC
ncbi:uncharacterized protein LOC123473804 [Daphnia magna]|uniref:uncharacterized protein LOC123473804 n=1 Tax=Daphnia magna TaxID=35525 RepID=UPI001E1BDD49|nr:uncharacterized protein LOC123473804 [Daphnia magna]